LASISYAPNVPCTSTTPSMDFNSEMTASSEPSSQFMRTYAVANYESIPIFIHKIGFGNI